MIPKSGPTNPSLVYNASSSGTMKFPIMMGAVALTQP
jgi:hypothetical protein